MSFTSANTLELSTSNDLDLDNSDITITSDNNELILENNSTDVTITKFETTTPSTTTSLTMKPQVLPIVYLQTPTQVSSLNKPNNSNNNMVVTSHNVPHQFKFKTLDSASVNKTNVSSVSTNNQSVIFTPVNNFGKQLLLQKQSGGGNLPVVPVSVSSGAKIGAYVTMLKPVGKPPEHIANKLHLATSVNRMQDKTQQKYVIAPMPKVTSTNRLPVTVTTNSVQSKISFMPLLPKKDFMTKRKVFNFKISDGRLEGNSASTVTVLNDCLESNGTGDVISFDGKQLQREKTNRSYELSINEEPFSSTVGVENSFKIKKVPLENKFTIIHKDPPKFSKHGVSILKKNYSSYTDRLKTTNNKPAAIISNLLVRNISNVKPTISLSDTAKTDFTVTKPSTGVEETIVLTGPTKPTQKPERRRKSNVAYRKDYDDIMEVEVAGDSKKLVENMLKPPAGSPGETQTKSDHPQVNIVNEKPQNECDIQKILNWEEGIGSLPGSQLKFIINEFNLVEYVTQDEYNRIIEKKLTKTKEKPPKEDFQEEMRCLECGCYGQPSEFINPKYCSFDCQEAGVAKCARDKEKENAQKFKHQRKRKRGFQKKIDEKGDKDLSGSDEDETSNENSQDKYLYPWACKKKGFSWAKYLDHIKAKSAPVKLFKDPFPYSRNGFRNGMRLEGVDPQHCANFCVLSISGISGYRVRLHFDGYPDNYDFWCNADSMDIFPIGWCEKFGHALQPPPPFTVDNFNWMQYLKHTKTTAAPKHLFANRSGNAICPNGFRVGMKLEAVDRKNTALVCVATVRDMMDNRILVHFDSWDDIYDYWADPTSPFIHPIGWCDQYGHNLTPPNDYPNPESFTWEIYLKETKAVAAPVRAFKQRPICGFKRGMRLECVDKRVPQLIRVATVDDVKEHQIRIHFDGWLDRYSYWVDDDSPDIHPVGWCQKTGHPLESPLTPDDVYDFLECPTVGCRGQGHIRGPKFPTHSSQKNCPYSEENIDVDKILPDRLLSPDRTLDAVVPVSREPKDKHIPKVGRPPKYTRSEEGVKLNFSEDSGEKIPKKKYKKRIKLELPDPDDSLQEEKALAFIENLKITPAEVETWPVHSKFLKEFANVDSDPRTWSKLEVLDFVSTIPGCENQESGFKKEEIDGEALLSLNTKDLVDILHVKVGPAVKLYNSIVLLRHHVNNQIFT